MTSPDTTVDSPGVKGTLGRLGSALGTPVPSAPATGRGGLDGFVDSGNRRDDSLRGSGQGRVSESSAGARAIVGTDSKSAKAFDRAAGDAGRPGGGVHGGGAGGGPGSRLGAFRSNMPVPGMASSALPAMAGLAQPVQGLLGSAQGLPQQMLSPLSSMLGGGALPGTSGGGLGSMHPMSSTSLVPGLGSAAGSTELQSRLSDFVSKTSGAVEYAWGGGHQGGPPGPSRGVSDGGGAADAHGDYNKIGVDCSGYTRWAYAHVTGSDVLGSSTSQSQYAGGRAVASPQVMDLAFPPSSFSSDGGPTHVQLYVGNGMVAEAPQSGEMVRVRPVSPGTEFRRYLDV